MTDSDRLVVRLREAMDAAQRDAEAADGAEWSVEDLRLIDQRDGELVETGREPGTLLIGNGLRIASGVPAALAHVARHSPAAVLRRIDRHRKLLDLHTTPHAVVELAVEPVGELFCGECDGPCTHKGEAECEICGQDGCDTVRLLAEGYGWTETRSTPDWLECMCTPSGECGNCWEKRQGAPNAMKGEPR